MTLRTDLLALTDVDLEGLTNLGTVRRARKELLGGKFEWEIQTEGASIQVTWSDGVICVFPAEQTAARARCNCAALNLCRHIVRSVLAYQAAHDEVAEAPTVGPWNPGDITDEQLEAQFGKRKLNALRNLVDSGLVVEVVAGIKPTARFHKLGHTVRFVVPHDARYTQCDCADPAPCDHAALAVWAFREASEDAMVVTLGRAGVVVDGGLLEGLEQTLAKLVDAGLANAPSTGMDRLRAVEGRLRQADLVWPAEALHDLRRQYDHYEGHDARFSPDVVADLVGELIVRIDALRAKEIPVPRLFVAGHARERDSRLGSSRLIGLGCQVIHRLRSVEILAVLQDDSTGSLVGVSRHFAEPEAGSGETAEDYAQLGKRLTVARKSVGSIGSGQLVIKTAKLYPDHRLSAQQSRFSLYTQRFEWENLRAPALVDDFREARARLLNLPPASLRPRRLGEDFHVLPVQSTSNARFDARSQMVQATLHDSTGETIQLAHPYTTRNRAGTERLLNWLKRAPDAIRFVAGPLRVRGGALTVEPSAVVFDEGGSRTMVQPWVDDMDDYMEESQVSIQEAAPAAHALDVMHRDICALVGDAVLTGCDFSRRDRSAWERAARLAEALGVSSLSTAIGRWLNAGADEAASQLLTLACVSRLARDI